MYIRRRNHNSGETMSCLTKSQGNMYKWVTHQWNPLFGDCPHQCYYCYVKKGRTARLEQYHGELRLDPKRMSCDLGAGKTIFVCHLTDMFAAQVPMHFIDEILKVCQKYPKNTYMFQTKNPERLWAECIKMQIPERSIIGTTIETNRDFENVSKAPRPMDRCYAFCRAENELKSCRTFITIEPIMKFDLEKMIAMMELIKPNFINIGADSKNCGLEEPTDVEIRVLITELRHLGFEVRLKDNLERIIGKEGMK